MAHKNMGRGIFFYGVNVSSRVIEVVACRMISDFVVPIRCSLSGGALSRATDPIEFALTIRDSRLKYEA